MWRLLVLVPLAACDLVFTVNVPPPRVGCFSDTFDGPAFDPAKWADSPPSPIGPSIVDGQVVFALPATNGDIGYLTSSRLLDMTDAFFEAELIEAPDPTSGGAIELVVGADADHYLWFAVGGGMVVGGSFNTDFDNKITATSAYDPTDQRRFRISFSGPTVTYQSFDDAGTAITTESLPVRFPLTTMAVELAGSTQFSAVATRAVVDNVLVDGPNCPNMQ
jgi:hypothetical protein